MRDTLTPDVQSKAADVMLDKRKPLSAFSMFRTLNGGWVIRVGNDDYGRSQETYSYSSDHDMLAALPGLIGAGKDADGVEAGKQWYWMNTGMPRSDRDGYENGD